MVGTRQWDLPQPAGNLSTSNFLRTRASSSPVSSHKVCPLKFVPELGWGDSPLQTGVFRDPESGCSSGLSEHSSLAPPTTPSSWLLLLLLLLLDRPGLRSLCPGPGTGRHLPPVSTQSSELSSQLGAQRCLRCLPLQLSSATPRWPRVQPVALGGEPE